MKLVEINIKAIYWLDDKWFDEFITDVKSMNRDADFSWLEQYADDLIDVTASHTLDTKERKSNEKR